jgi:hypothetical protein
VRAHQSSRPLCALLLLLAARSASSQEAPFIWLPGSAREIPRTSSASRDTPLFQSSFDSRWQASAGLEFGLALVRPARSGQAFRLGMYGMVDLQNADQPAIFEPVGTELLRGLYGFSISWAAEDLAHRWLGPQGALELSLVAGHESDHALADFTNAHPDFEVSPLPGDIESTGGNFLQPDLAARFALRPDLALTSRLQWRVYLPGSGPIRHAPGVDLVLRWKLLAWLQPQIAGFAERWYVDHSINQANDGGFARLLCGLGFPGRWGEATPFGAVDVGNGDGLLVNRRALRLTVGVRYAAF